MVVSRGVTPRSDGFQVHDRRVSLFLDGLEEDGTPFDTQPLTTRLTDTSDDSTMWVGAGSNGKNAWSFLRCFSYYHFQYYYYYF